MRGSSSSFLRGLGLAAALCAAPAAASAITSARFEIARTSPDPAAATFSGGGRVSFMDPADDPADIAGLSLAIETLGGVYDAGGALTPKVFSFAWDAGDVVSVAGLAAEGAGLTGLMRLAGKEAAGGGVFMSDLLLDFASGLASGFCFTSGEAGEQCVFGGGSSTSVEARLSIAPVPAPAPLLLLLAGLAAGLAWTRPGAART